MPSPLLYEVNTRCWLRLLSEQAGHPITLADVPQSELERWRSLGFTHIWLMGVWQVGEGPRAVALHHWREKWRREIPSSKADVHGSPFAIREYALDSRLGEPISLLLLKERLGQVGLKLILDFVPNHLGLDSPEPLRHPDRFVQAPTAVQETFERETKFGKRHFAYGRDPYFAPWTDTIQLDYRMTETQQSMVAIAQTISMFGYGLRCDMSMLLLPEIFEKTWQAFPSVGGTRAMKNFWRSAIPAIRQLQPQVDLIAECYWDREQELQDLGFDFTYNKRVLDYLGRGQFSNLRNFLTQCSPQFLQRSVHFLENHDEPRAAATFSVEIHKAAALLILGLPGMALLHDGQLEGRRGFTPIQMSKRAPEECDPLLAEFYENLLSLLQTTAVRKGDAEILKAENGEMICIRWTNDSGTDFVCVNFTDRTEGCDLRCANNSSVRASQIFTTGGDLSLLPRGEDAVRVILPARTGGIARLSVLQTISKAKS